MNELIETIFTDFTVDGVSVPVKYLYYEGHGNYKSQYHVDGYDDKDNN